jgi:hypothetical protein
MNLKFEISDLKWGASRTRPIVASAIRGLAAALRSFHWWVRQVSGDAAYENYLRAASRQPRTGEPRTACCEGHKTLSPREFYLDALRRRYTGVSRCC